MKEKLIAYANDFVSFVLSDKELFSKIKSIILFGSTARGDFTEESDIDLFIDTDEDIKQKINSRLFEFYNSKTAKNWALLGVRKEIICKAGKIKKWKELEKSILSDGIYLYGKYEKVPKKLEHFILISYNPIKESKKRVKINRILYGYFQKLKGKKLHYTGIIEKNSITLVSDRTLLIKSENSNGIISLLKLNKITFSIFDFWKEI